MNEDIIKWAQEAGFSNHSNPEMWGYMTTSVEDLARFAALVRADERETLSKVTDEMVIAADKAMFGQIVQGYRRFETVRLGLEAALKARSQE
jgi:hypothetical protein